MVALPRERIYSNNTVVGRDTGDIKAAGEPARTTILEGDDGFKVWLAGLCGVHPSARRSRVLQPDVLEAAKDAYRRCPDAVEHVALLEAYLGSKQSCDRNKLGFYRPPKQYIGYRLLKENAQVWRNHRLKGDLWETEYVFSDDTDRVRI